MLHRAGTVQVDVEPIRPFQFEGNSMRAVLNGAIRLVYDLSDGPGLEASDLGWCDFYFKRSYDSNHHACDSRIRPYGLNYAVYAPGDWRSRRLFWAMRYPRKGALAVARLSAIASRVLVTNEGCTNAAIGRFEAEPSVSDDPNVLMVTRSYDPLIARPSRRDECRSINEMRVSCIRALRREFGPRFIGGIVPGPGAARDFRDSLLDETVTRKGRYLRLMKQSDVCVTSAGLWGSNGWRLAEYVAAARPVVTEHLRYVVPGGFDDGRNYLGFGSADECVTRVRLLMDDPERRLRMGRANAEYYKCYLRPDRIVLRSLEVAAFDRRHSELASRQNAWIRSPRETDKG
jgi:hypothetical protein